MGHPPFTPEQRAQMSAELRRRWADPEYRARMSAAHAGKPWTDAQRAAHAGRPGHPHTPETRALLSAQRLGIVLTAEHRANIGRASKGRPCAPETREKLRAAAVGYVKSAEHRARLRDSLRGHPDFTRAVVKGECAYCLEPATTFDHMIPRGRPGWDSPDNVVAACVSCNAAKGKRTPEEWFSGELGQH